MKILILFFSVACFSIVSCSHQQTSLPRVWMTYSTVETIEKDFADLKAHGVELVSIKAKDIDDAKEKLGIARKFGMKYHISLPEITEDAESVRELGVEPVDALMIGGVYQGKAIDRHLFEFQAKKQIIIVEPPVYNKSFAYTLGSRATGKPGAGEPVCHYFPDMPAPLKAEIIVPLGKFDGKQHLKIISATIEPASNDAKPENDSVTPDMPFSTETAGRKLYRISFDLSGLDHAMLDRVGIAVYWPYHGTERHWMFHRGHVSAAAQGTREAMRIATRKELTMWKDANNGVFPSDVVVAARLGDECFYITGHSDSQTAVVNYPLWDYSEPTIQAYQKYAGQMEYPRTWGFPEIYGEEAYGCWLYNLHELTAGIIGAAHDEIAKIAPGLKLFRNTTRAGIFGLQNLFDGSGQELLTQQLDIVHLDPYPVFASGYTEVIPRDMSYMAGLARRYNKPLIPWMQAHLYVYGGFSNIHPTPEQIDRMAEEQWEQGFDGIIWLGYSNSNTFPKVRPDSWERASVFHRKIAASLPPKPKPDLAVLRSYNTMAVNSLWENGLIRNPADWLLQQFLEVWAVQLKRPYDVFELPPILNDQQKNELMRNLRKYSYIVSSIPWENAWVIDAKGVNQVVDPSEAKNWQKQFEADINKRIFFSACQAKKTNPAGHVYQFDLQQIANTAEFPHEWVKSAEFGEKVLSINVANDGTDLVLTPDSKNIDWTAAKYLVCEVWHDNPSCAMMRSQFYRKTGDETTAIYSQGNEMAGQKAGPRITCLIRILPNLKTKMIFPLSHLDGQEIFLTRQPRQLKGTVSGSRIDPADVGKVAIRISPMVPSEHLFKIQVASAYLTAEQPEPFEKLTVAVVDSFGQWTARDWPGKVHGIKELKASMAKTEAIAASATLPDEWSIYGGWKQLRFKPKGFFYTHHDGKRWWLVDPAGYAFISAGIDRIRKRLDGLYSGLEDFFEWTPPKDDSLFSVAYYGGRNNATLIDFLKSNLIQVYGSKWAEKWEEITAGQIKLWRVNTVAAWSDYDIAQRNKIPYVFNMNNFPSTKLKLYRDFPDVFDPAYQQEAIHFAQQLEPLKNDPCLIGYFLQNEPKWAFGDNNLAFEMFATPTPSFTKKEMSRWLQKKYGSIKTFNEAWKQSLSDFNALEQLTMKDSPSGAVWNDCSEFSGIMVDRYVEAVCKEVKKVDPNHLNLGMRYAGIASELCYRAGALFDVFSFNGYSQEPPRTDEIARRSGKPVIIGEWHFGSVDRGLPAAGLQSAENQTGRGEAYRHYFEQGIARPEIIGIHWFQWYDEPVWGDYWGENYNIGFLDICMQPYEELTKQATLSHERMYRVASGSEPPYNKLNKK